MAKYTDRLVEKIVSLIEEDTFSISEICSMLKISRKSFYEWKDTKPEFKEAIEKATEHRDDKLLMTARRSLKRKLEGYTLSETRTTYVPDKDNPEKLILKSKVVRQKEYAPDTHAIKLILLQNDKRADNRLENVPPALTIVVNDAKTVEHLNLLREDLINNRPKEVQHIEPGSKPRQEESPATDNTRNTEIKPVEEKKSKYVTLTSSAAQMVPPGYRYRR
ncbi:MAG: hypothetical protein ACK5KL_09970 [Dysgonomonas sp.]